MSIEQAIKHFEKEEKAYITMIREYESEPGNGFLMMYKTLLTFNVSSCCPPREGRA